MKNIIYKILIAVLILLIILCFIWGIEAIYKITVLNKIFKNMESKIAFENYYMKMISNDDDSKTMEIFYKNGTGKLVTSDGTYTWTDGKSAYLVNEEKKFAYELSDTDLGLISNEVVASMLPGYSKSKFGKILLAGKLTTKIRSQNIDNQKYYCITTVDDKVQKNIWINKETLLPSEIITKIGENEISYNFEISFDTIKNEQVLKPNLDGYEIQKKENNKTTENSINKDLIQGQILEEKPSQG